MPAPLKFILRCLRTCRALRWQGTAFALALLVAVPATAQMITTDEAVARARQQVPGKLVAVNQERQGDQMVYRVRILGSDGVVRTVFVNAHR